MASARMQFQDLEEATFVGLLSGEVSKLGASLSGKADHTVKWKESGEVGAATVWDRTIRAFRDNFDKDPKQKALARLNGDQEVALYVQRAIAQIASKATDLAKGTAGLPVVVDGWHVIEAAHWVIKRFRAVCPPQIEKGTFEKDTKMKWAHGDLCRDFETREE